MKRNLILIMLTITATMLMACARGKPDLDQSNVAGMQITPFPARATAAPSAVPPTQVAAALPIATTVLPTARPRPSNGTLPPPTNTAPATATPTRAHGIEPLKVEPYIVIAVTNCVPMELAVAANVTDSTLAQHRESKSCLKREQLNALPDSTVLVWRDSMALWTERDDLKSLTAKQFRDLMWTTGTGTQTKVSLPQ